ncbi:hypothetical protein [Persephonella sp.]
MMRVRSQAGFSTMDILIALVIIMILAGGGFLAYQGFIKKGQASRLISDFQNLETAMMAFANDTGTYPGLTAAAPFPDALLTVSVITDTNIAERWRGPYIKVAPVCPFDGCQYQTDFTTGQAANPGEIYQYFIVATNVPIENALEVSRKLNGDQRVQNGECLTADIPNVVAGTTPACKVYLSANTGGAGTRVDVFYTFATGRL